MVHKFNPKNKHKLDNPERRKAMPPKETLERLMLLEGDKVADIGCGTGYFTIVASEIVGEKGEVYAIDTSLEMLDYLQDKIEANQLKNIELIKADEYGAKLKDNSLDFILISYVIHEIEDKDKFLENYLQKLKSGGKLAIIEWKKVETESGPPLKHRIGLEELSKLLTVHNIKLLKEIELSENHYGVIAQKG
ncbi:FkbM family methyltransferase [Orenia metallireducens]|jgi:ubiquinone/menaquinone biosynthesis C-methylase UbiE|uniref:class I SAM-dependent methyltransferase n=1 Tax=Orenia metallireducens TaxID=1413210 RepID=UPI000D064BD5|nr:class I SAM-dependent methyltransferase [Orenia metallireducens]PRX27421.1 FkbM family methyltransferase [Orenia metallireducens]